ncbi:hypothetical protein JCM11251_006858 [Rhodosporidiobolus azoricus]
MHVFVTGASGWVGSALLPDLLSHGHTVLALARSDDAAKKLEAQGVEVQRGSLEDLDSIREGAIKADGVVHLAFKHDFENYVANGKLDEQVVNTICEALRGTNKPFVLASGTAFFAFDSTRDLSVPAKEDDTFPDFLHQAPRVASHLLAMKYASLRVRTAVVRLPPSVHGSGDYGFVPALIGSALTNGFAAVVAGAEPTYWPACHVRDAATLFRLALEKAPAGSSFHAVGDGDGLTFQEMASIIGEKLDVPVKEVAAGEEAEKALGFLARFATVRNLVSAEQTKEVLGWQPKEKTLQEELREEGSSYFRSASSSPQ